MESIMFHDFGWIRIQNRRDLAKRSPVGGRAAEEFGKPMLFSIDEDMGERIIGWLMPDNPAATPRIIVHLDPEHHIAIDAFVYRPLLKEQGLHNSGVCGFVADESNCPGIGAAAHLEIRDGENNVLIYRRHTADNRIDSKFLRLETQLFRSSNLDEMLIGRFQMPYRSLELLPEETTRSIFAIPFSNSIFASGRIFWRVWEPLLRDRGFKVGMLLRDPFEEMSERLLILKWASLPEAAANANALMPALQRCAGHIRHVDLSDSVALEGLLLRATDELRTLLYNPLVYQLAAPNAFDPPPNPAPAAALDSLAELDAVGLRDDVDSFLGLVGAVLDLPEPLPFVALGPSKTVTGFADILREMSAARVLIEQDLEVYAEARRVLAPAPAASA
ncbi:hypothetical protein CR492_12030 [Methylocella silvestris]|uniref:Uncharacterized protein n=2 Tax=Methylocella silvestris TaxID=199596 RepID=A0A2J7TFW1_METSI|nr:hypothetical protein CR492_12030 [Methylocella silvestris]